MAHSPTRNFFRPGTHLSDFHLYQALFIGLRGCDDMAGLALNGKCRHFQAHEEVIPEIKPASVL